MAQSSAIERRVQAYIKPKYFTKIKQEAEVSGASESSIINLAVKEYYDKRENKCKLLSPNHYP